MALPAIPRPASLFAAPETETGFQPGSPDQYLAVLKMTGDLMARQGADTPEAASQSARARRLVLNYEAKLLAACMRHIREPRHVASDLLGQLRKTAGYRPSEELLLALERAQIYERWDATLAEPVLRHLYD